MSRLAACFDKLKAENKTALVPYVAAGDPNPSVTVPLMHHMVENGANIIELGVPFSDPMADGPTIQLSMERALVHHTGLHNVLDMVKEFRIKDQETPVVLMGYLNPIERMGYVPFAEAASIAGVDGVLTVDLPPEEGCDLVAAMNDNALNGIFLIAPTTINERMGKIAEVGSGFLYYVSLKGVTGSNILDVDEVANKLANIRSITDLPLGVGFGIKDAESAIAVSKVADAVIVGSAIVKKIESNADNEAAILQEIGELLAAMRQGMDTA
ncbi:MAG: Tryptophan synthase alpha chain (EC [uncultured Thiotrichaceae bacterium]|uniref:Tryptophan synthase alpha chain n=1 Tax=uncultured Thiotrichaceae bacterium TaxID=298394 RepID=A0A6S6SXB9_9GAMM|nr:MAG: Tryptophan synthase alpha chain (EC [uncultured Thiotrichaceae bacterium]